MILAEVRDYLKSRTQASVTDIALHFKSDPEAVRGMMDIWIRKGKVRKRMATDACGSSCNSCESAVTEIYEWIDAIPVSVSQADTCNKH